MVTLRQVATLFLLEVEGTPPSAPQNEHKRVSTLCVACQISTWEAHAHAHSRWPHSHVAESRRSVEGASGDRTCASTIRIFAPFMLSAHARVPPTLVGSLIGFPRIVCHLSVTVPFRQRARSFCLRPSYTFVVFLAFSACLYLVCSGSARPFHSPGACSPCFALRLRSIVWHDARPVV